VALTVSAALIVRDEESFLRRCLESLSDVVDEIVVVDTGSRDNCVDVAKSFGAVTIQSYWNGDFSRARNIALDKARCDWILYIDADERLDLDGCDRLADAIIPNAVAGLVAFRPKSGFTRYREYRLFRNDPRIRFQGRIHETMVPAIEKVSKSDGLPILKMAVEIDHFGYDGDQSHKHSRNLPLLLKAMIDNPKRIYYHYHLAETYAGMGQKAEAITVARSALSLVRQAHSPKERADGSLVYQTLARLMLEMGEDAVDIINEGLTRMPWDFALKYLKCQAALRKSQFQSALELADELMQVEPTTLTDHLLAFDERIFRSFAYQAAGFAAMGLGRTHVATQFFALAGEANRDEVVRA